MAVAADARPAHGSSTRPSTGNHQHSMAGSEDNRPASNSTDDHSSASNTPIDLQPVPRWVNLSSGGLGGMAAAAVTCPLELVKTRMQSSKYQFIRYQPDASLGPVNRLLTRNYAYRAMYLTVKKDGVRSLWQGLGPMLVGVIPARAIYFASYQHSKPWLTRINGGQENALVHLGSAAVAGFSTSTATSPIWMVKTRVQLARAHAEGPVGSVSSLTSTVVREIWKNDGIMGFYRGLSASYLGIIETAIQFMIYEKVKLKIEGDAAGKPSSNTAAGLAFKSFFAAASAKLLACCLTYPHEVVRTRLREEDSSKPRKYRGLLQTFSTVYREEGIPGMYRGMSAHLLRVVPNAAILFLTFEMSVHAYRRLLA